VFNLEAHFHLKSVEVCNVQLWNPSLLYPT
jgi:hypothetical protein